MWAFQIGFVGSVAFGLLAMVLLEGNPSFPSRIFVVSIALLCSLMCSGVGVIFLAAVGVELAVDRHRRRFLLALVAPAAAFGEWFLAFGAALPGSPGAPCPSCTSAAFSADIHKGPLNLDYILSLVNFAKFGVEASMSGIFGLPGIGVYLLLPLLALVALHWFRQGKVTSWQIGFSFGLLFWFALTALGRAQYGPAEAGAYRYVYVGIVFLIPLVADAARELPWRSIWRPGLSAIFIVALAANALQLRDRALVDPLANLIFPATELMQIENAELQTVQVFRGAPDMTLDRSLDSRVMPVLNAGPYFAAIDELGSPVAPATVDTLRQLPSAAVDRVMLNLFGSALTIGPGAGRSASGLPCRTVDSTSGSTIDLLVPDGQSLMLRSSLGGDAYLYLSFLGDPPPDPFKRTRLQPGTPEWLYVPNTGRPSVWRLRIKTSALGVLELCGNGSLGASVTALSYRSEAASGILGGGWSSVADSAASGARAAKTRSGTFTLFQSDFFGPSIVPMTAAYDVWYRIRVTSSYETTPEMTLGLWDDQAQSWIAPTKYSANQVGENYSWVKVAESVIPIPGHSVHFIASFVGTLGTDWYVDEAVMVSAGYPAPTAR